LDDEYKKAFVALKDNKEKLKILWDLEHSLLEINVGHKLIPNHKNLERIERFIKKSILMVLLKTSLWIQYLCYNEVLRH
jgi:hypothetical protein